MPAPEGPKIAQTFPAGTDPQQSERIDLSLTLKSIDVHRKSCISTNVVFCVYQFEGHVLATATGFLKTCRGHEKFSVNLVILKYTYQRQILYILIMLRAKYTTITYINVASYSVCFYNKLLGPCVGVQDMKKEFENMMQQHKNKSMNVIPKDEPDGKAMFEQVPTKDPVFTDANPLRSIPQDLQWSNVNYNVGNKRVLNSCWGYVPAGKVCAILGPSGAGKVFCQYYCFTYPTYAVNLPVLAAKCVSRENNFVFWN